MKYDAAIIGGGHNGLVTAALLAKSGYRVLVLEERAILGGVATTEEIFPGFRVNTGAQDAGMFLPEIVQKLELTNLELEFIESPAMVFAPQLDGPALTLWRDPTKIGKKSDVFLSPMLKSSEIFRKASRLI
ncbi:FAD-dependent oxidoreductase [bacterium]|nr:FAD-dependent oxidoreductase [bacterium]